jgi:RNA polymerase sigma-70 factor, ECF subfamily
LPSPVLSAPVRLASVHHLPLAGTDDAALVALVRQGNPAAASSMWNRFAPMVRGILKRSLGPPNDVEDLVQTVFMGLFDQIDALREAGSLRSFVFGITVRVLRTELRKRRVRRWLRLSESGSPPEVAAPEDDDEAREALRRLYAILSRVDDETRLYFVLRHVEGFELTEVADALNVSLATAKRKLSRVVPRVMALVARDPLLADYLDHGGTGAPREAR